MDDFKPFIRAWRRKWAREAAEDARAKKRALVLAPRLAALLVRRFGARKVILAGSLARGDFRQDSDIDLAAEGIPDGEFFRASAALEERAKGFSVDLVPLESATPAYLADLKREGVILYGDKEGTAAA